MMETQSQPFAVQWKHVYPQLVSDTIVSLTSICGGLSNSFVNLLGVDVVDVETKSWLASVTTLMTILGTLAVGPLVDKLGRRPTLLTVDAICILSWALISAAAAAAAVPQKDGSSPSLFLLVGVPLTGLVRGGIAAINVVYVTEITHKKYRSTMLSFSLVYLTFGILAVGLLGTLVTWKTVALLCLLFFCVVFALTARYTVESPIWLANFKADSFAAKRCLRKLIADQRLFEREWMEMKSDRDRGGGGGGDDADALRREEGTPKEALAAAMTEASFYRPAAVLAILLALSQISGVNYMIYFAVDAIARIGHDFGLARAKQIFAALATCKFAFTLFATTLSTTFRRKTLLYASAWATLASSLTIAVCSCSWLRSYTAQAAALDYAAVIAYVVYMSCGAFGIWLIPYTLIGELLPNRLRGSCAPFFICFSYAVMSAGAKLFPSILAAVTVAQIFLFYALVSALILIFVKFYVPETGDKTLKQIENYFSSRPPAPGPNRSS